MPHTNETEAANRAEATAILIRAGYRVYRSEADVKGLDLVVQRPSNGELCRVQLKARACVDERRYGGKRLWMLFPDGAMRSETRTWFLIEHDRLFRWFEGKHGHTPSIKGKKIWSVPKLSRDLSIFLAHFRIRVG